MKTDIATFSTPHSRPVRFHVRPDTSDWNTCNAINGEHDEYHLPEHLTGWAVDVGSHIGACVVSLLVDNPNLFAVAIEALPENVELIHANAKLNGVADRLVVMPQAAGDGKDVRIGYGADGVHDYIGNASAPPGNREVIVPGVTLEDVFLFIQDVPPVPDPLVIEWLKIDCEGCELPFLRSRFLGSVLHIEGEVHPEAGGQVMRDLLEPTHVVTFPGWEANPDFGPFVAVRR